MSTPIAVIDSGVGGLSVWRELIKLMPLVSTIYLADSLNCPYGGRSAVEIYQFAKKMLSYLQNQEIKLVIIACNTITVTALHKLRKEFPTMILIGTVPAVKVGAEVTHNGKVGIFSTEATAKSTYVSELIVKHANHHRVIVKGSQFLVPLIEKADSKVKKVLEKELVVFKNEQIDTLVLACSHFPFIQKYIREILPHVVIVDPSLAIAQQAIRMIKKHKISVGKESFHTLLTTGDVVQFEKSVQILLGDAIFSTIQEVKKVDL